MKPLTVTVFGSSAPPRLSLRYQRAYELGRAIAAEGWTLCNGGYGGTMEATAKGALEAGGHTIGVTCRIFGRSGPNPFIKQEVPTFDLLSRLNTLIRLGNAFVVLPGGTGTLLELALVWEYANKRLRRPVSPIVLLGDHWTALLDLVVREQPEAVHPFIASDVPAAIGFLRASRTAGPDDDTPSPPNLTAECI